MVFGSQKIVQLPVMWRGSMTLRLVLMSMVMRYHSYFHVKNSMDGSELHFIK